MQAIAANNWPSPPIVIGQAYAGGFYAGQIGSGGTATHNLIIGPVSSAQSSSITYKNVNTNTIGANSNINGPQNTADIVADGNATTYPSAHFCNDLVIGGFSDWYMPARNELEVCYYNLKPTTQNNSTGSGVNANAVPARASNYTTGDPAQTSATDFKTGNAEAFTANTYWSSTEQSNTAARLQNFSDGAQSYDYKYSALRVRAVRRVAV